MSTWLLFFLFLFTNPFCLQAQRHQNEINVHALASIPIYQDDQGFGFFMTGLYGIHHSAQLSFSAGICRFISRNSIEQEHAVTRLIPFLFGYKQNIRNFFIWPSVGLGELGGRIKSAGDYANPSVAAFFAGIGTGYQYKRFDAGIYFQNVHGIENSNAGLWYNRNFNFVAISVGYAILKKIK